VRIARDSAMIGIGPMARMATAPVDGDVHVRRGAEVLGGRALHAVVQVA
jgi:hypothetical protein